MEQWRYADFTLHKKIVCEPFVLTEDEIIAFGLLNDPQEIHINRDYARKSRFGGVIASGFHIFTLTHKRHWVPRMQESFICGVEINRWKFYRPVFANSPVHAVIEIIEIEPDPDRGRFLVTWRYQFSNERSEALQSMEISTLHTIA
jgi:acyl dehydratase